MKYKQKVMRLPKPRRIQQRRDSNGNLINTLVGATVALALVKGITK